MKKKKSFNFLGIVWQNVIERSDIINLQWTEFKFCVQSIYMYIYIYVILGHLSYM